MNDPDSDRGRLGREALFHDTAFSHDTRKTVAKYYEASNGAFSAYRSVVLELAPDCDVLEFGCGVNSLALDVAEKARSVCAIDISPFAIGELERMRAAKTPPPGNLTLQVMNVEQLEFPDSSFGLVHGSGILHHLDLPRAYRQTARVLKPGGTALFYEPLGHNVLINLYRRLTPKLRTPDEHPLRLPDIQLAHKFFSGVETQYFHLFSIASALLPKMLRRIYAPVAEKLDRAVLGERSPLRHQAWIVLLRMTK